MLNVTSISGLIECQDPEVQVSRILGYIEYAGSGEPSITPDIFNVGYIGGMVEYQEPDALRTSRVAALVEYQIGKIEVDFINGLVECSQSKVDVDLISGYIEYAGTGGPSVTPDIFNVGSVQALLEYQQTDFVNTSRVGGLLEVSALLDPPSGEGYPEESTKSAFLGAIAEHTGYSRKSAYLFCSNEYTSQKSAYLYSRPSSGFVYMKGWAHPRSSVPAYTQSVLRSDIPAYMNGDRGIMMRVAYAGMSWYQTTQNITTTDLGGRTPKFALIYWTGSDGYTISYGAPSMGATDGTRQICSTNQHGWGAGPILNRYQVQRDDCLVYSIGSSGLEEAKAVFVEFISNGMTINWTKATTYNNKKMIVIFFAGANVDAYVGTFDRPTEGNTTDVTTPGFEPNFAWFFGAETTINTPDTGGLNLSHGFAINKKKIGYPDGEVDNYARILSSDTTYPNTPAGRISTEVCYGYYDLSKYTFKVDRFLSNGFRYRCIADGGAAKQLYVALGFKYDLLRTWAGPIYAATEYHDYGLIWHNVGLYPEAAWLLQSGMTSLDQNFGNLSTPQGHIEAGSGNSLGFLQFYLSVLNERGGGVEMKTDTPPSSGNTQGNYSHIGSWSLVGLSGNDYNVDSSAVWYEFGTNKIRMEYYSYDVIRWMIWLVFGNCTPVTSSKHAYILCASTADSSKPVYFSVSGTEKSSKPVYLEANYPDDFAFDSIPAMIIGYEGSKIGCYTTGQDHPTNSQAVYLIGQVKSQSPAFLWGYDHPTASTPSSLWGSVNVQSAVSAWLYCHSNKAYVYLKGHARYWGRIPVFLVGTLPVTPGTAEAFLSGGTFVRDTGKHAYLSTTTAITSSQSAHVRGLHLSSQSSKRAYTNAGFARSYKPVFLNVEGELGGIMEYPYLILTTSNASLSKRFRVLLADYDDGTPEKSQNMNKTIGGGVDISQGAIYQTWSPTIRVRHTETDSNYGTLAELRTLYELNNPNGTPTDVITMTDHHGTQFYVKILGTLRKAIMGCKIEGTEAWFLVRCQLIEVIP